MNNNEYQIIGLYDHNVDSYRKVKSAYDSGKDVVGIVHATGTGKSYNALQLAYDNKDKKIVYVVPSNGIIEHINKIIEDNPNLDMRRDFPNLEFRTYQSFISLDKEEITNIDCDLLILDEFHHIGAPIWGARINTMIDTHPDMKIFGMTAYTVRDRGTIYERDMANSDTDELFSNKIESRYDLCDAMIDGVLPKPIYKSAYINLIGTERKLEERVQKLDVSTREYQEYMKILSDVKKRIHEAPSIPNILRKNIKPNGKYIYFCPPYSEDGTNDIETIKKQVFEWFKQNVREEDIIFYTSTSVMGIDGKHNRDAFYDDVDLDGKKVDDKLRVMFAINQYNEGIHAPNIDGVIMGRGTTSDIVYFEQLGRALSVRGNTKETFDVLEKYSVEDLIEMCKSRDIPIKDNLSKEELIEKLIAPVVIDLTNNYEFIKELENNLRDKIKEIQENGLGSHRDIKIRDASFDIEIENQDLFEILRYVSDRLTMTWEDYYELAKIYYEHHGNLEVSQNFRTNDGYTKDDNGIIRLGQWIFDQRRRIDSESERGKMLANIGMRFETKINVIPWNEMYEYAKKYYEYYGNLEVPYKFNTNDGYTYDDNGIIRLGHWIFALRKRIDSESERGKMLANIGMRFENKKKSWEEMYEYAKKYYEHYGDLEVPVKFRTNDGYTENDSGLIWLGPWIYAQRKRINPESERGKKLTNIGMRFKLKRNLKSWEEMYEYAKMYYEHHGDLEVPAKFRTNDGYTENDNGMIRLGQWTSVQRRTINPESEHGKMLVNIGMRFENKKKSWEEMYEYAKMYYEHHGDLEVPVKFRTNDGYTENDSGIIKLGRWILGQRRRIDSESERGKMLVNIGMRFERQKKSWEEMYEYARIYYEYHGDLEIPYNFRTNDGYTKDDNGIIGLGRWILDQRRTINPESERGKMLANMGMRFERQKKSWEEMYEYAKIYYEHYGNLEISALYRTNDGYTKDDNGIIGLGRWISAQRTKGNSESERGKKLSQIGMIWDVRKNKEQINNICSLYGVDTTINKSILKHISIQELQSKIEFLKSNSISIIDKDGKLIDMFSMSDSDMKDKYGITLEELITKYYFKDSEGRLF